MKRIILYYMLIPLIGSVFVVSLYLILAYGNSSENSIEYEVAKDNPVINNVSSDEDSVDGYESEDADDKKIIQSVKKEPVSVDIMDYTGDEIYEESLIPVTDYVEPIADEFRYRLIIPSAGINVLTKEGDFSQSAVDANDVVHVVNWSKFMNCDLFYGHNTRTLKTLYKTEVGDIITVIDSDGTEAHYEVIKSVDGVLDESYTERGELVLNNTHYDEGYIRTRDTGEILFAYTMDGYDNDNLALVTCYKEYDENGRWYVEATRVIDEYDEQKELYNERYGYKKEYIEKTLYERPNTLTYVGSNYNYAVKNLIFNVKYDDGSSKLIKIQDIIDKPIYRLTNIKLPEVRSDIVISNATGEYKTYNVKSVQKCKRYYSDSYDSESGFQKIYLLDSNNRAIFSFNNIIPDDSSIIIDIINDDGEYLCRLE